MSIGSNLQNVAQSLVHKFSNEIGYSTLKTVNSEDYNTDTGNLETDYNEITILMVFDSIEKDGGYDIDYINSHEIAIIAGNDLITSPKIGDVIIKPDGGRFRIDNIEVDQYGACYNCYIVKDNE